MCSEDRANAEQLDGAADVRRTVAGFPKLAHRPPQRSGLRVGALPLIGVTPPGAMDLLGGVDQQKEEGECASDDRGAVQWKRIHVCKKRIERRGIGRTQSTCAAETPKRLDLLECGVALETTYDPAERGGEPTNVFV
jgi:hypothetical protein